MPADWVRETVQEDPAPLTGMNQVLVRFCSDVPLRMPQLAGPVPFPAESEACCNAVDGSARIVTELGALLCSSEAVLTASSRHVRGWPPDDSMPDGPTRFGHLKVCADIGLEGATQLMLSPDSCKPTPPSGVFQRLLRRFSDAQRRYQRDARIHSHWDRKAVSDETACRLLRYVGIKLRGCAGTLPQGELFQRALIVLVVYFDSRKMSALDLWKLGVRDTAGALLLREPELPADSELTSAEEAPLPEHALTLPEWGELLVRSAQELTDRDSLSSAPTQLAVRNLARPLLLESPDSCVDEPIDPEEVIPRLRSAISMATLGNYGAHKISMAIVAVIGVIGLVVGIGALALSNSTTLSATALSAPFALMIGCLIGSLHLRYRLKYEFHRRSFAVAETVLSASGICITISTVLLGFVALGATGPLVITAAMLILLMSCILHLSTSHTVAIARIRFESRLAPALTSPATATATATATTLASVPVSAEHVGHVGYPEVPSGSSS